MCSYRADSLGVVRVLSYVSECNFVISKIGTFVFLISLIWFILVIMSIIEGLNRLIEDLSVGNYLVRIESSWDILTSSRALLADDDNSL